MNGLAGCLKNAILLCLASLRMHAFNVIYELLTSWFYTMQLRSITLLGSGSPSLSNLENQESQLSLAQRPAYQNTAKRVLDP